ncbi:MAG: site-specific DNA-methyltransferase [Anaerolineae bacterium]
MPGEPVDYVTKTTPNITEEHVERLKAIFPECVTEGKIDFEMLRATLGDAGALAGQDAYTFTWAGKQDAFRAIQTPSAAALRPAPDESIDFENTHHIFIEGENLEVLKLLYKSYFGQVKMIYIDPPYNTGHDFVYRDDYREPRRAYLEKTGQVDAEGNLLTSNPETSGRYHSAWLSMMYPRLFLTRQLLREDGVIFVSIDDTEMHHLRLLMNEIFGEEQFIGALIWKSRHNVDSRATTGFSGDHEYVLAYGRKLRGRAIDKSKYSNPDNDSRGLWMSDNMVGLASAEKRPNLHYDLIDPKTGINYGCPAKGWRYAKSTMDQLIAEGRVLWPSSPDGRPRHKKFLSELRSEFTGLSSILDVPTTSAGTQEIRELLGSDVFDFPKPLGLIRLLVEQATSGDEIVLDFFAGSCPTAEAVLELNRADGGNRRFIMVQLPEPTPDGSPAQEAGYETVAEVGKERIRRVIAKMQEPAKDNGQLPLDMRETPADLGFKVFKLAPSTFRQWEPPAGQEPEALEQQLILFEGGLEAGAEPLDVIYEVILKEGHGLNARIEPLALETNQVYRVTDEASQVTGTSEVPVTSGDERSFYICLDDEIHDATIDRLDLGRETVFICLDTALDDSKKVNLTMQCILKVI